MVHPEIEETHIDDPKNSEEFHNIPSSDKGNFGDSLTEYERKIVFILGPSKPQGPFPKDSETKRCFSAYHYSYLNKAGILKAVAILMF
ncbi:hypothetical protein JTB14_012605 [Gonioctena quinquepunctata]|nr:hypothetical protein JTB14_012605 [Gonioctena quinquepunctata]